MSSRGPRAGRLVLCGLGPYPARTATVAALHALGRCREIFVAGDGEAARVVAELCPGAALRRHAGPGSDASVLRALRRGGTVGLTCAGHPFVLDGLAGRLLGRCRALGISVETIPSVSTLDVMLAGLGRSLGLDIRAVQALDARRLVRGSEAPLRQWLVVSFPDGCGRKLSGAAARELRRRFRPGSRCWVLPAEARAVPAAAQLAGIEAALEGLSPGSLIVAEPGHAR